jgi:hypothetical protein
MYCIAATGFSRLGSWIAGTTKGGLIGTLVHAVSIRSKAAVANRDGFDVLPELSECMILIPECKGEFSDAVFSGLVLP